MKVLPAQRLPVIFFFPPEKFGFSAFQFPQEQLVKFNIYDSGGIIIKSVVKWK